MLSSYRLSESKPDNVVQSHVHYIMHNGALDIICNLDQNIKKEKLKYSKCSTKNIAYTASSRHKKTNQKEECNILLQWFIIQTKSSSVPVFHSSITIYKYFKTFVFFWNCFLLFCNLSSTAIYWAAILNRQDHHSFMCES